MSVLPGMAKSFDISQSLIKLERIIAPGRQRRRRRRGSKQAGRQTRPGKRAVVARRRSSTPRYPAWHFVVGALVVLPGPRGDVRLSSHETRKNRQEISLSLPLKRGTSINRTISFFILPRTESLIDPDINLKF